MAFVSLVGAKLMMDKSLEVDALVAEIPLEALTGSVPAPPG